MAAACLDRRACAQNRNVGEAVVSEVELLELAAVSKLIWQCVDLVMGAIQH